MRRGEELRYRYMESRRQEETEAEMRMVPPQVEICLQELEEAKARFSPGAYGGNTAC
jgi:hypothetical protein